MSLDHEAGAGIDWPSVATALEANREALPWDERLALAGAIGRQVQDGDPAPIPVAVLLATDPSPEVRKAVAEALVHLPEGQFLPLAAVLGADRNAYVKTAAERAVARRRRGAQQAQRNRRNLNAVASRLASFEETYGTQATRRLRRIADEHFSALVRQTDHDLRQILSPIRASITTLSRQFDHQPDQRFCLSTLRDMSRRMVYLEQFLSDLKEYARSETAERRRERLADLVQEAIGLTWAALRRAGSNPDRLTLVITVPEHLTVAVARHQAVMALVHLIRNAAEAFEDPASRRRRRQVAITAAAAAAATGGTVTVSISDNACGIHPEDLELLREFVPGKRTRKPSGTGFGLPTAARYLEANGGTLALESTHGEGSTATLTLPIACEDEEP